MTVKPNTDPAWRGFGPGDYGGFVTIDELAEAADRDLMRLEGNSFNNWRLAERRFARDAILDIAEEMAGEAEGWWEPVTTSEGRGYIWHGPLDGREVWGAVEWEAISTADADAVTR